jgi:tetrahydromethanopterin S-methyltransferase subunit G
MVQRIIELALDESAWLPFALVVSIVAVTVRTVDSLRSRHGLDIGRAMSLFYGSMIGVMAGGHLLAVTIQLSRGAVLGRPLAFLYGLGLALALPAAWLALGATRSGRGESDPPGAPGSPGTLRALNAWLGIALLALGPHNWPLALPAALNLAYSFRRRRIIGWAIVTVAVASYAFLLVGSLIFAASGQSFEQFSGME